MNGYVLYSIAFGILLISAWKDLQKTKIALKKAWKSFLNILPQLIVILLLVGISLALLSPAMISKLIGAESGLFGVFIALLVGAITLIPGFVAFPLAAALYKGGAGYPQIAAFVSTLMAVGIVTLPTEIKYLNKSTALLRNGAALLISIIFTMIIGKVMK